MRLCLFVDRRPRRRHVDAMSYVRESVSRSGRRRDGAGETKALDARRWKRDQTRGWMDERRKTKERERRRRGTNAPTKRHTTRACIHGLDWIGLDSMDKNETNVERKTIVDVLVRSRRLTPRTTNHGPTPPTKTKRYHDPCATGQKHRRNGCVRVPPGVQQHRRHDPALRTVQKKNPIHQQTHQGTCYATNIVRGGKRYQPIRWVNCQHPTQGMHANKHSHVNKPPVKREQGEDEETSQRRPNAKVGPFARAQANTRCLGVKLSLRSAAKSPSWSSAWIPKKDTSICPRGKQSSVLQENPCDVGAKLTRFCPPCLAKASRTGGCAAV